MKKKDQSPHADFQDSQDPIGIKEKTVCLMLCISTKDQNLEAILGIQKCEL